MAMASYKHTMRKISEREDLGTMDLLYISQDDFVRMQEMVKKCSPEAEILPLLLHMYDVDVLEDPAPMIVVDLSALVKYYFSLAEIIEDLGVLGTAHGFAKARELFLERADQKFLEMCSNITAGDLRRAMDDTDSSDAEGEELEEGELDIMSEEEEEDMEIMSEFVSYLNAEESTEEMSVKTDSSEADTLILGEISHEDEDIE